MQYRITMASEKPLILSIHLTEHAAVVQAVQAVAEIKEKHPERRFSYLPLAYLERYKGGGRLMTFLAIADD